MKVAVALLLKTTNGKYVMVSRKDDPTAFGLPGGKAEEGETLIEALKREIKEEIGYDLKSWKIKGLLNKKDGEYQVMTFVYEDPVQMWELSTNEEGVIAEGREELLTGPFGEYNAVALAKYENE